MTAVFSGISLFMSALISIYISGSLNTALYTDSRSAATALKSTRSSEN